LPQQGHLRGGRLGTWIFGAGCFVSSFLLVVIVMARILDFVRSFLFAYVSVVVLLSAVLIGGLFVEPYVSLVEVMDVVRATAYWSVLVALPLALAGYQGDGPSARAGA